MDQRTANILYIGFMLFVVVIVAFLFFFLRGKTAECLKNPLVYGARQMGNVECNCIQLSDRLQCPANFFFNTTAFVVNNKICNHGNDIDLFRLTNVTAK